MDINKVAEFECCVCQKVGKWPVEAYHPLGSLQPFCSPECRQKAKDMANGLEQMQIAHGISYDNVQ
jgi:hypothetical protein